MLSKILICLYFHQLHLNKINEVMKFFTAIALLVMTLSCAQGNQNETNNKAENVEPTSVPAPEGYEAAVFASGCFWCVEAIYESVEGVKESISGYAGGHTKNPTYEASNTGKTGHAEAVKVIYDPEIVDFKTLIDVYFASQNVTQQNGQGPDRGSQYRSILFYENDEQKEIIDNKVKSLQSKYDQPIAAEIKPFEKFWVAEDYHQDYKKKHPNNRYIQNVSNPRFQRFAKKMPEVLKSKKK
jgi:peptide-methionine (S)-S-oxide reductase